MIINNIAELTPVETRAIIINVGTKLVTSLALLSALRYAHVPVLLVDCQSEDGSWNYFNTLMQSHNFDLLSAPLKVHGLTIDWLFRSLKDKQILLLDSDIEIVRPEIVEWMMRLIKQDHVFGSGFTHGPCWLHDNPEVGYYQERMWIPITLLKVSSVQIALDAGVTFAATTTFNDFATSPLISRWLARRFSNPKTRTWKLSWLHACKRTYYGLKPCYIFHDTGAAVYQYLKYKKGLYFAGFPTEVQDGYVTHFHGVTRGLLNPLDPICTQMDAIMQQVRKRLHDEYDFDPSL